MVVSVAADSCAACGVVLAPDQRYCVECGHPRGTSRMPAFAAAVPADAASAPAGRLSGSSRPPWYPAGLLAPNPTVLALVGALLLAIGIGVLIGRSNGTSASAADRVTTVFLSGPGAAVGGAAPSVVPTTPAHAATATPAATKAAAKAAPVAAKVTPAKAVHVGSSGTGPGFQKGKFTGNFFGGG